MKKENSSVKNVSGPCIRIERECKGWTQADLAERMKLFGINMPETTIQRIEQQTRQVYDKELYVFVRVLGVSYEKLLGIREYQKTEEISEILVKTQE